MDPPRRGQPPCLNDHLNPATETTVLTDRALKEMVTELTYSGHLSTADYSHYAARQIYMQCYIV